MTSRISRAFYSVAHVCTGFGSYMMSLQSRCLNRRVNGDCEGVPTADEARRDYIRMVESTRPF